MGRFGQQTFAAEVAGFGGAAGLSANWRKFQRNKEMVAKRDELDGLIL